MGLLPRFFGAYIHVGWFGQRTYLVISADVFANVPPQVLCKMERFDLKGSSDDRMQRKGGEEQMEFDLLRTDRKLIVADSGKGEELLRRLDQDVRFLREQRPLVGQCGVLDFDNRGTPGLMDYSLLLGLV